MGADGEEGKKVRGKEMQRVLVVDDDREFLLQLKDTLLGCDYSVATAENGREALKLVWRGQREGEEFDLVITDIVMPEMDGIELLITLRREKVSVPILVLSRKSDEDCHVLLRMQGCHTMLQKPVPTEELLATVRQVIEASMHRDEGTEGA